MSRVALLPNSRSDPDNIYYTATIINNNTSTNGQGEDPIARFVETRDVPIIRDANDYEVNIIKVQLNGAGKTLPILIPQIQPLTSYTMVSMTWTAGGGLRTVVLTVINPMIGNIYQASTITVSGLNIGTNRDNLNGTWTVTATTATTITITMPVANIIGTSPYTFPTGVIAQLSDPNMTIYSVQLNAAVYDAAQTGTNSLAWVTSGNVFIQWVAENWDNTVVPPKSANPGQVDSSYYYLYSYNHWVVLVNRALQQAYTNLIANIQKVPALTAYTMKNRCPTVEFDEVTKLFSFYTDTTNTAWGLTEGPPTYPYLGPSGTNVLPTSGANPEFLMVGYNLNFEGLMTNYDTIYFGSGKPWVSGFAGATTAQQLFYPENFMIVRNKTGTNIQTSINPATGLPYSTAQLNYVSTQDFISVDSLWSPVGGIILTTQLLPIRNEFTSAPVALGEGNINSSGTSAFQTVLIDFADDQKSADGYRGLLSYTPSAEFIPVSMTQSHQEVKSIDFIVSWRNRLTNQLVPLRIYNCASLSVRMFFKRKS